MQRNLSERGLDCCFARSDRQTAMVIHGSERGTATGLRLAGIGKLGTHAFLHTYRRWLDSVGTLVGVQQRLMRHSDIRTTMNIYGDAVTFLSSQRDQTPASGTGHNSVPDSISGWCQWRMYRRFDVQTLLAASSSTNYVDVVGCNLAANLRSFAVHRSRGHIRVNPARSAPQTHPPFSCEAQHRTWQRTGAMAMGGRTDLRLAESVSAAARSLTLSNTGLINRNFGC
jgi:hypothetical protein